MNNTIDLFTSMKDLVKPRMTKKDLRDISENFKRCDDHSDKTRELLDALRNQIFLDSILSDNNCLKQIAYDLDEVVINYNFDLLIDIAEHIDQVIKNDFCEHNKIFDKHTDFEKMKWLLHFRELTKNFTDLKGWNSYKWRNEN